MSARPEGYFDSAAFRAALTEALERERLSVRDAGKRCGLSQTTIHQVAMRGRRPCLHVAMRIAERLLGRPWHEFTIGRTV